MFHMFNGIERMQKNKGQKGGFGGRGVLLTEWNRARDGSEYSPGGRKCLNSLPLSLYPWGASICE